jgi:hypothetical protein
VKLIALPTLQKYKSIQMLIKLNPVPDNLIINTVLNRSAGIATGV